MNDVETQFNALYQKTLAFYENAMNGDKTHPFVLFKIKQLRLKKSNFKKVKDIDNDLLANALRTILLEDLQSFVEDVKEYELKMKAIRDVKKLTRRPQNRKPSPRPQQRTTKPAQSNSTYHKPENKEPVKQVKQPKSNQKYLRSMRFKNNSSKKKGKR